MIGTTYPNAHLSASCPACFLEWKRLGLVDRASQWMATNVYDSRKKPQEIGKEDRVVTGYCWRGAQNPQMRAALLK